MVLVDTSVWMAHFREGSQRLKELLADGDVLCHPFVVGELACGSLRNREEILILLQALPQAETASFPEILAFIEAHGLSGKGIGLVDVHLLAAASLGGVPLWSEDKRLKSAARQLDLAF